MKRDKDFRRIQREKVIKKRLQDIIDIYKPGSGEEELKKKFTKENNRLNKKTPFGCRQPHCSTCHKDKKQVKKNRERKYPAADKEET